jgi:phosphoribosyl-ATP pyrophosphohydrolase
MAKSIKKSAPPAPAIAKKLTAKGLSSKKAAAKIAPDKKLPTKKLKVSAVKKKLAKGMLPATLLAAPAITHDASGAEVLDRLYAVITSRQGADPSVSHSARLLSRGTAKVAQKFGEEAVECLIEAVAGNRVALIAESADVLYHLLVLWVNAGVTPAEVWGELLRREGVSGIAEKSARPQKMAMAFNVGTRKIP